MVLPLCSCARGIVSGPFQCDITFPVFPWVDPIRYRLPFAENCRNAALYYHSNFIFISTLKPINEIPCFLTGRV